MVTKGIIKSIDLLGNTCTVHIPFFETAGNDPIIETATVSNTPGSYNGYKVGDAVYVAFEDGNMSTPVVIGKLYLGTEKEKADPRGVSNVEESSAAKKATLPADSKLTAEIDSNVPNTTVPYSSLSSIANGLNTLNTNVGQMDRDYGNRFKQVISNADGLKSELEQTAERMVAKVSGYEQKKDADGNPIYDENGQPEWDLDNPEGFGWELKSDYWKVFNENKPILTANADGLKVTGTIEAIDGDIGKFIIGKIHNRKDSNGDEILDDDDEKPIPESGLYTEDYIRCFLHSPGAENLDPITDTPYTADAKGVYIGTDGIKLGKNFSVDPDGNITAKGGHLGKFIIGEEHEHKNDDGSTDSERIESGIYTEGFIECFKDPTTEVVKDENGEPVKDENGNEIEKPKSGVYIGTDGIKLGDNFSIDPNGNVTATSLIIKQPEIVGDDEGLSTANIVSVLQTAFSDPLEGSEETTLGSNWLSTTNVVAQNLTAGKIEVKDNPEDKNIIFYANANEPDKVQIGKFVVDSNSISLPTRTADGNVNEKFGADNTVMICTGSTGTAKIGGSGEVSGWNFTAGTNFGVRTIPASEDEVNAGQSELYVSKGKIGGFTVGKYLLAQGINSLEEENEDTEGDEKLNLIDNGSSSIVGMCSESGHGPWAIWAGEGTFGDKPFRVGHDGSLHATAANINGNIQATGGEIGGFTIDSTQLKSNNENLILNGADGKIIAKSGEIGGFEIAPNGFIHPEKLSITTESAFFNAANFSLNNDVVIYNGTSPDSAGKYTSYIVTNGNRHLEIKNMGGAGIRFKADSANQSVQQNITFTYRKWVAPGDDEYGVTYKDMIYLDYKIDGSGTLIAPLTFIVYYRYAAGFESIFGDQIYYYTVPYTVTIPTGSNSGTFEKHVSTGSSVSDYYVFYGLSKTSSENSADFTSSISFPITNINTSNNILYSLGSFCPNISATASSGYLLGDSEHLWRNLTAYSATITTSDRNEKHDIKNLLNEFEGFYDDLKPVSFIYNHSDSERTHVGFIAQDVEESLIKYNIDTQNFAGICIDEDQATQSKKYFLRYEEFIPLNTLEIQKLKKRVADQEARITELEEIIKKLKTE